MSGPEDFGGPKGAMVTIGSLLFVPLLLNMFCNQNNCSLFSVPHLSSASDLFNQFAFTLFCLWLLLQGVLYYFLPGPIALGRPLKSSKRLIYNCNGLLCLLVSVIFFLFFSFLGFPLNFISRNFLSFCSSGCLLSLAISLILYFRSFEIERFLLTETASQHKNSFFEDYLFGRELNPRFLLFDLKLFLLFRFSAITWFILNLNFFLEALFNGTLSPELVMIVLFQASYNLDILWSEAESALNCLEITTFGAGFLLTCGSLVWGPFVYCLQTKILSFFPPQESSILLILFSIFLHMAGLVIFRQSNAQKNGFRKNPLSSEFINFKIIKTERETQLLAGGWWGKCRHPNYLGDILMAFSWAFITGFSHIIPFFYPLFLTALLIDRCKKDDQICSEKYGKAWDEYCRTVPYKIIPYLY